MSHKGVRKMYYESFPRKLKKAREDKGLLQIEVEAITNIKRSTLSGYEIGRTQPDLETLAILADLYGVSIDWLLGTKGGK
jgi:transcriptional regulator with XRE-family HTH domain